MNELIGVFPGKFLPPHRGHLNAIIQAATQVEHLYVVVSDNKRMTRDYCKKEGIRNMPLMLRARWLAQELSGFDHIEVLPLDESDIPSYPQGAKLWAEKLISLVPETFHRIFGGEEEYRKIYMQHFPDVEYVVYDPNRQKWNISATRIREDFLGNWEYILGPARPHFAKRVLITGTESCGKTTLTKYLAKLFHTSWSEEYGRYHADYHMGGNERIYIPEDFVKIVSKQRELDEDALRSANKISFFDTDAVVTQYYAEEYLGEKIPEIENFVDPDFYDLVLLTTPSVKWVPDGKRLNSESEKRWKLHQKLKDMYVERGFEDKIVEVSGDLYYTRLKKSLQVCENLLKRRV